jgi:mannose/fructose/N-acetylgalactosamine-specific phosphotransferase system component IIC
MSLLVFGALSLWGTLAGLDLVSVLQGLFSRPLIAGAGAGLLLNDPEAGLRVGLLLELFALDVLPVGAARYPDYGPGVVASVVLVSGAPWGQSLGVAALFALGWAALGGWSLQWLRQVNGRALTRNVAGLAAGDPRTIARLQWSGLSGDLLRSLLLTVGGLAVALLLKSQLVLTTRFEPVTAVAIGAGVAAAAGGAIRSAGRGARLRWLVAGVTVGLLAATLR